MNLSEKQLGALQESGKFDTKAMEDIRAARERGLMAVASGNLTATMQNRVVDDNGTVSYELPKDKDGKNQERALVGGGAENENVDAAFVKKQQENVFTSRNTQQAGELPVAIFTQPDMAKHITPQALEQRMRNGFVSDNDKKAIEENVKQYLASNEASSGDRKKWKNWTERNTIGAGFDFDSTTEEGPQLDLSGNINAARQDRDNNQTT